MFQQKIFSSQALPKTLIKYCHPDNNIREGCKTVRFGSCKAYREMEMTSPIADPYEGTNTITIETLNESQLTLDAMRELSPFLGHQFVSDAQAGRNIIMQNCTFQSQDNHFIWCAGLDKGENPDSSYASSYKIESVEEFLKEMSSIILANACIDDFMGAPSAIPSTVQSLGLKVEYVASRVRRLTNNGFESFQTYLPRRLWPYGLKDIKYAHENEFRMIFFFCDEEDRIWPVKTNYKNCLVTDRLRQLVS